MKKIVAILLILALSVSVSVSCGRGGVAPLGKRQMFMGGSSAASSTHMYTIFVSIMWNKHIPEINITPVETKSTVENYVGIEEGRFELGSPMSYKGTVARAMYKQKPFENRPVKNVLRALFYNGGPSAFHFAVRKDSDMKSLSDLHGRRFSPGIRGAASSLDVMTHMDAIGVKPNYFFSSAAEAAAAFKEGRIEAMFMNARGWQLDAVLVDVMTKVPLKLLEVTDKEAGLIDKAAREGKHFQTVVECPAGAIRAFPGHPAIRLLSSVEPPGVFTAAGVISQELGYKMVKVAMENWEDAYIVYAGAKQLLEVYPDLIAAQIALLGQVNDLFLPKFQEYFPGEKLALFHPGAVQYFKEKGHDVPKILIPPEYKE